MAELAATGLTGDQMALLMELTAAVAIEARPMTDEAAARRREKDREYQAERRKNRQTSADSSDVSDTPPSLDKETSPRPPKEINPTPRATRGSALARKAGGFGPPIGVELQTWNAFCSQRKKALSQIAYDRMLITLAECADVGWPPGEIVERSIEKTWETLYVPSERKNGSRPANDRNREQPESPWVVGLRQAEAREAH